MAWRGFKTFVGITLIFSMGVLFVSGAMSQDLGTRDRPIYMLLVPFTAGGTMQAIGDKITADLYQRTGLYIVVNLLGADSATMIAAFATSEGDTFGFPTVDQYVQIYRDTNGNVTPRLGRVLNGCPYYFSSIYARRDYGLSSLEDLNGKMWCYNYPSSTSGYILPKMLFDELGIVPDSTTECGSHTRSMWALIEGQCEFCTGWGIPPDPPEDWTGPKWSWGDDPEKWIWDRAKDDLYDKESCTDLRRAVCRSSSYDYDLETVLREISVLGVIGPIPNSCLAFGPDFPTDVADTIVAAIQDQFENEAMKTLWGDENFYAWTAVADIVDSSYDGYRALLGYPIPEGRSATGYYLAAEPGKIDPDLSSLLEDPSTYIEELPEAIQRQVRETGTIPVAIWLNAPLPDEIVRECNQFKESVDENWSLDEVREARQAIFEDKSASYTAVEEAVLQFLRARGFWDDDRSYASLAVPVLYTDLPVDPSGRWIFDELQGLDVVETIYLAGVFEPKLDSAVATIEVPSVWERKDSSGDELTGNGVKIAIVEGGRIDFSLACFGSRKHLTQDNAQPTTDHKAAVAEVAAGSHKTYSGVAFDAILLSADFGPQLKDYTEAAIAKAIDWALKKGADVLNASFGEVKPAGKSHTWSRLFDFYVIEHMRAVTAAAGNEGKNAYVCAPASGYNVIAVGGIDDKNTVSWLDDKMASFSNSVNPTDTKNEKPDVCAVAVGVKTAAYGYTDPVNGTSFAAPAVAGTIGLLIQREAWLAVWPEVTKAIVMASAIHNVTGASRHDDWEGAGTVVASEADKVVENGWFWKKVAGKSDFPISVRFDANKGETVRFVIAWDSHAKKAAGNIAVKLEADLDLQILNPAGNSITSSTWSDNSFEIVEFVAPTTGRYEARITQASFNASFEYVGAAWHRRVQHRIAFVSNRDGNDEIYVMNPDGSGQTQLTYNSVLNWHPAWSPDRRRIAFASNRSGVFDVYVMNADGSNQTNLSKRSSGDDYEPSWSPDGNRIAFTSSRGNYQIYVMKDDGSHQANVTSTYPHRDLNPSWSRDGRIAFQTGRDKNWEIYVMNEDGSSQTNRSSNLYSDKDPALSPDGKKIAFMSNRDGDWEIYVMDTDRSGLITLVTRLTDNDHDDMYPTWSPGSSMIAFQSYLGGDWEICVVNVDGSGPIRQLTDNEDNDTHPAW